jgi:hypothetical protein
MKSTNNNNYQTQKIRGIKRKLEAIKIKGGGCEKCGYAKNIAALDFHHINPEEKTSKLDLRHFSNNNIDKLELELNKCQLLCANCHREEHHENMDYNKVVEWLIQKESENNILKTSFFNKKGKKCLNCETRFLISTGKKFCSKQCRESIKNYPTLEEIEESYSRLKSWEKVAIEFHTTRRVIQRIRKV